MLNMTNKNISMDAQSAINGTQIASMNANINGGDTMVNSGIYLNMNIADIDAFIKNKAAVLADFTAFCDKVAIFASEFTDSNKESE